MALQTAGLYIFFFLLLQLLLYKSLNGALPFLWSQFQLSSDNSEAVAFYQENNWWLIGTSLICLILIPFVSKEKLTREVCLLLLLPFFADWKYAMARGEEHHLRDFLNFILVFSIFTWLISNGKNLLITLLCIISASTFLLSLALNEDYSKQKNFDLFKVYNLYNLVTNYDTIAKEKNLISENNSLYQHLPDSILNIIGDKTTDVFPWNYSFIAASKFNWQPRPVIHSYAAYTHWLDKQNSDHITSGNSAQFVIWKTTDLDYNGDKLDGIDGRYLLNDEPQTLINFFARYHVRLKTKDYSPYEKNLQPLEIKSSTSEFKKIKFDEWINVPENSETTITRAKLNFQKTFLGKLKSLIYKGEAFYVFYELENKKIYSHRIVPKNAVDGIWINPFVQHPENNLAESKVKKIKLVCFAPSLVTKEFEMAFEEIQLMDKSSKNYVNILKQCFDKNEKDFQKPLFFVVNKEEFILSPQNLGANPDIQLTNAVSLSPPMSFELNPGKSIEHFIYQLDTTKLTKNMRYITFLLEAYIKPDKPANASLIIAQDSHIKWSQNIKHFMTHNSSFWHYITHISLKKFR